VFSPLRSICLDKASYRNACRCSNSLCGRRSTDGLATSKAKNDLLRSLQRLSDQPGAVVFRAKPSAYLSFPPPGRARRRSCECDTAPRSKRTLRQPVRPRSKSAFRSSSRSLCRRSNYARGPMTLNSNSFGMAGSIKPGAGVRRDTNCSSARRYLGGSDTFLDSSQPFALPPQHLVFLLKLKQFPHVACRITHG